MIHGGPGVVIGGNTLKPVHGPVEQSPLEQQAADRKNAGQDRCQARLT